MTVVFVSSTFNHHQSEISKNLYDKLHGNYFFIETTPLTAERKKMNWGVKNYPEFVKCSYRSKREKKECQRLINDADVVIWGSAPFAILIERLMKRKLTVHYSERLFKKGFGLKEFLPRAIKHYPMNLPFFNQYLLCSSAYAAFDYGKLGCYKEKMYQWGYFPEFIAYAEDALIKKKVPNSILWVGRMIDWKHPELAIGLAKQLKKDKISFELHMIGNGAMQDHLQRMIENSGLQDCVKMLGALSPKDVRKEMEQSSVFIATSDYNEGWGAVINEAMNSGCAVVASHAMGAVPFLIQHKENGLVFKNHNSDDLYTQVKKCILNREYCEKLGLSAYRTIKEKWNADYATDKLIELLGSLMNGQSFNVDGKAPCCVTKPIRQEEMFHLITGE